MATYNGFGSTLGGNSSPNDNSSYVFGLTFKVTQPNMQLDGFRIYVAASAGQSTAPEDFALWIPSSSTSGSYVAGSKVTSGTFVNGWNFIPCNTPIPLTSGTTYTAVKSVNKGGVGFLFAYNLVTSYFAAGNPGAAGIVNGPLTIFSSSSGSNPNPFNNAQQIFIGGPDDVIANYPDNSFLDTWYGMDVQVSNIAAARTPDFMPFFP